MSYLLGIDVSTTATKALLIDEAGKVVAVAATEYNFATHYNAVYTQYQQLCPALKSSFANLGKI